jgi:superfamily II DNA/RNA helicase
MKKPPNSCTFSDFNFSPDLFKVIKSAGYTVPTEVQCKTIPAILHNRDVLAGAETGSGKTAAFALPLLEKLRQQKQNEADNRARGNHIRALILVPTRELALQISETINAYAYTLMPRIKAVAVFGGVKINPQMMALRGGADVLVATPGRLLDLVSQNAIKFNKLHTLVLDEVDRLVGDGFKEEIEAVFKLLPNQRQNLMFTATFPSSIRYLIRRLLKKPVIINIDPSQDVLIDQRVFTVNYEQKNDVLAHLLNTYDWKQILIFCSVKHSCDNLVKKLENRGISAVAMHSNKEQRARTKALRDFKSGHTRVLIATDVAARGLDIEQLPCVINFELPRSPNDYTHRIGRTGRAGETGFAISLIAHHEYAHFSVIEKRSGVELKREQVEGFEADATAPPAPTRQKPKKKAKTKLSKKKRQRLLDQKKQNQYEASVSPQKISKHADDDTRAYKPTEATSPKKSASPYTKKADTKTYTKTTTKADPKIYKAHSGTRADQPPRKKSVAALGKTSPYSSSNERLPRKNQVAALQKPSSEKPYTPRSSTKSSNTAVWGKPEKSNSSRRDTNRHTETTKAAWNKAEQSSPRTTRSSPETKSTQTVKSAWSKSEKPTQAKEPTWSKSKPQESTQTRKAVWESPKVEKQPKASIKESDNSQTDKTTKTTGSNANIWDDVLKANQPDK